MHIFFFKDYEKYIKSHNRFKSFLISQLDKIRKVFLSEDIFINLKKELFPYLIQKVEVKIICNENEDIESYKIEIIEPDINDHINDNDSDCSTVDLNNYVDVDIDEFSNEQYGNYTENNYENDNNNQTYLIDPNESDEESFIEIATRNVKLEDLKLSTLKQLNNYELRNMLQYKNLTVSKNGTYLTKKDMIKKLLKEKRKKI